MILAGDVGGTKIRLACFTLKKEKLVSVAERTVSTAAYKTFGTIIKEFLKNHSVFVKGACFAVAAPIVDGCSQLVNLPWRVDAEILRETLKFDQVGLINDLEATAYGIEKLPETALAVLQPGKPVSNGNIAVIAAGTSLGEAMMVWDGKRYRAIASEGGHADFAPRSPLELELARRLFKKFEHASYARLVSGPGLLEIYLFLRKMGVAREPKWLKTELDKGNPAALISEHGLTGRSELCVEALHLFVSIYGAEAGNLALRTMARGGVYIGGGIAPKIVQKLKDGVFMKSFLSKGRLTSFLATIPVKVILDEKTALYGAAYYGLDSASQRKKSR